MQKLLTTLLTIATFSSVLFAQGEIDFDTKITDVTVYLKGAEIYRSGSQYINKGEQILVIDKISPYVDKQSIRVAANDQVSILSVNYQIDYINDDDTRNALDARLDSLVDVKDREKALAEVISEDMEFLRENRKIVNSERSLSVTEIDQAAQYQSTRMKALKLELIQKESIIKSLDKEIKTVVQQLNTYGNKDEKRGKILIKIDAASAGDLPLHISYLTENASWTPSYDISVDRLDQPMILSYKANVIQQTKENWENVNLSFSSNNPEVSPVAPKIQTYYLGYNIAPPSYEKYTDKITGKVTDYSNEAMIGANVLIKGTTIGTVADIDGNFELPRPAQANEIVVSYVGYESVTLPISSEPMHIMMKENVTALDEVVVTGYSKSSILRGKTSGVAVVNSDDISNSRQEVKIRGMSSQPIPTNLTEKATTVSFSIDIPYTILSDNQSYTIEMDKMSVPVTYQYLTTPKINTNAYLMAHITEWEQYNLLAGPANVVLEDNYIGQSLIELTNAQDVLTLSLGVDKSIVISREKQKDFTDKSFIGKNKTDKTAWLNSIKNNKEQSINIKVVDQVPVSNHDDIDVKIIDISGAQLIEETGQCIWEFMLSPNATKTLPLQYEVKYPKWRELYIE